MAALQWRAGRWRAGRWRAGSYGLQLLRCLRMFASVDVCECLWTTPNVLGCVPFSAHKSWCFDKALERSWMNHSQSRTWHLEQAVLWESRGLCYHSGSFNSNSFPLLDNSSVYRSLLSHVCAVVGELSSVCSYKDERPTSSPVHLHDADYIWNIYTWASLTIKYNGIFW